MKFNMPYAKNCQEVAEYLATKVSLDHYIREGGNAIDGYHLIKLATAQRSLCSLLLNYHLSSAAIELLFAVPIAVASWRSWAGAGAPAFFGLSAGLVATFILGMAAQRIPVLVNLFRGLGSPLPVYKSTWAQIGLAVVYVALSVGAILTPAEFFIVWMGLLFISFAVAMFLTLVVIRSSGDFLLLARREVREMKNSMAG